MALPPSAPHSERVDPAGQLAARLDQVQRQFEQARQGMDDSHRLASLGAIAAILAHEYNNILTPIISYAQMALDRPNDPSTLIKAVRKSLQGCQRAGAISTSLLGFARLSGDHPTAALRHVVEQACQCLDPERRDSRIELLVDVPDVVVAIAPDSLEQVIQNLIVNARQAMYPGGGQLRIIGRADCSQIHLEVADTGPGIPGEIRDRIFEPFVSRRHGEACDLPKDQRTGLGLWICQQLIESAGGSIQTDRQAAKGARFLLALPSGQKAATEG